jgi:hypothetical protein
MSFKIKDKKTLYSLAVISVLVAGAVFGSYTWYNIDKAVTGNNDKQWRLLDVALAADADPGNGNDGIVNVYIYPLASKSDVNTGCSEATAYEHGDADGFSDGEELQDSTPVGSTYIIAIEVQFSDKAYNTTSSDWDLDLVKAEITSSDLSLSSEVMEKGTDFFDQDGTSDAKLTFYVDNSDSGWTMTTGASITVDDVDIYYYG